MAATAMSASAACFDCREPVGAADSLRHYRNENAMALASAEAAKGPAVVAVACDGVSTSANSEEASLAAVRATADVLLAAVRTGDDLLAPSGAAVRAATDAVARLAVPTRDLPSSPFVSAVLQRSAVTRPVPFPSLRRLLRTAADARAVSPDPRRMHR